MVQIQKLTLLILWGWGGTSHAFQQPASTRGLLRVSVPSSNNKHFRIASQQQHRVITTNKSCSHSALFASNESSPEKNKRKYPVPNPFALVANVFKSSIKFQANFRKKFGALSKKGKLIVSFQLVIIGLFFGYTGRTVSKTISIAGGPKSAMQKPIEVPYSVFMDMVEKSGKGHIAGENPAMKVDQIIIGREKIGFNIKSDEEKHALALKSPTLVKSNDVAVQSVKERQLYASKVIASPELIDFLRENAIPFKAASTKGSNVASTVARSSIILVYMFFLLRMYRNMAGGGASDTPGKLAKKVASDPKTMTKFEDIEGIDNAKFEVMELVDALKNPGKYAILGARAPTGLLLEGPPGTGKTMLARACAATAGVPLLYCSGSDFVEMFVGRGAARVRKTFERAGKMAPCIVFIDELDALGKSRGGEGMGMQMRSNDEAEQTLNQLLACMDGLDSKKGICVLAATNRREVLDQALIRPGRFDRIIKVTLPDTPGRERILRVHAKKLPGFRECSGVESSRLGSLGQGNAVDLSAVASVTSNLSGAELEFIVNEAAIRAVRRVSAALREGVEPAKIKSPAVCAMDFEDSVRSFFETRKPNTGSIFDALKRI